MIDWLAEKLYAKIFEKMKIPLKFQIQDQLKALRKQEVIDAYHSVKHKVDEDLAREEFIDEIVERINRKQVKR